MKKMVFKIIAVIALVAAVITNTETIAKWAIKGYRWIVEPEQTLPKIEIDAIPNLPIRVLGTQHSKRPDGRYFNFLAEDLDQLLKRQDWDCHTFFVSPRHDGHYRLVVMWRRNAGGPGTAHGRYEPVGAPGDWKANDSIFVDPRSQGLSKVCPNRQILPTAPVRPDHVSYRLVMAVAVMLVTPILLIFWRRRRRRARELAN